jgi:hypothetical protein
MHFVAHDMGGKSGKNRLHKEGVFLMSITRVQALQIRENKLKYPI